MHSNKQRVQSRFPHAACEQTAGGWSVFTFPEDRRRSPVGEGATPAAAWKAAAQRVTPGVNAPAPKHRSATDEEVLAWARRHDLSCWDNLSEARAAFEDAETLHMTYGVGIPDGSQP